jgi:hypothetical protein
MKTIFDTVTRQDLAGRIKTLTIDDKAKWGSMTVSQMVKHNIRWEEMMSGKLKIKRKLLSYIFGKVALNNLIGDEKPIKQSIPTFEELKVKEVAVDIEEGKKKWISLIEEYASYNKENFVHPFMGKMTREQVGQMVYKHTDHHLRQFGR